MKRLQEGDLARDAEPSPLKRQGIPASAASCLAGLARGFQQALAANPRDVRALMGMSLVAMASGQSEAAIEMAQAAIAEAPSGCTAWVTLGQALKAAGRARDAEAAYRNAIRSDGSDPLARIGLGELRLAAGLIDEAMQEFVLATRKNPALAAAHMGLGHALARMGRNHDALARYEHALALRPRSAEAEFATGFVLARLGRVAEAEQRYRRALSIRPDFAAAWANLGSLLREQGREMQAEAALRHAVDLRPDMITGWLNLAVLERERSCAAQAEAYLNKALAFDPNRAETHIAVCQLRIAQNDPAGAEEWLDRAFAVDPQNAEAVNMRGILLHNKERFAEAVAAFAAAEALGHASAASNRGNSLLELGRDGEALRAHELAVERDPHSAGHLYNLALTRLRLGEWQRGWRDYEARWRFREIHRRPRTFRQTRWQGEDLARRSILLHAEQGLGDTIQFCRFAPMVAARGGSVILQVQEPAECLMRSLDGVRDGRIKVAPLGHVPPAFDLECPLMSLPAVFGTTVESVPWPGAYLGADPALLEQKMAELPPAAAQLRVGIAWAGNPRYKADRERSIHLLTLLPLLRPGSEVQWISLQKGDALQQLAQLPDEVTVLDGASRDRDLADTAALMATLDLVVTTDTSIAHLAGAMAKPVWILLPYVADWRWMQRVEITPWYPTARLFRQRERGNWAELLERVRIALEALQPRRERHCPPPFNPHWQPSQARTAPVA